MSRIKSVTFLLIIMRQSGNKLKICTSEISTFYTAMKILTFQLGIQIKTLQILDKANKKNQL